MIQALEWGVKEAEPLNAWQRTDVALHKHWIPVRWPE